MSDTMLPVLVALNQFKGTLSNKEACDIVAEVLERKGFKPYTLPIGDGGRGTLASVQSVFGGETATFDACDPLGRPLQAQVLCIPNKETPSTLYIESAEVCGYHLVSKEEQDVLRASSRGLGELLKKSLSKWGGSLKNVYVGLGDSATSDAGMGMLSALGFEFLDTAGRNIWTNANGLRWIQQINVPTFQTWSSIDFTILCDVLNPLCGTDGSARTFAQQKGASLGQVLLIEEGMEKFAQKLSETIGQKIQHEPMTGAAGGLSAAFRAFFKAKLVRGAQFLMDWLKFDRVVEEHALVITGEGKTDSQTLSGKAPFEVVRRAERAGKKSILISGSLGHGYEEFTKMVSVLGCYGCGDGTDPQEELASKTNEIFSDPQLLEKLGDTNPQVEEDVSSPI